MSLLPGMQPSLEVRRVRVSQQEVCSLRSKEAVEQVIVKKLRDAGFDFSRDIDCIRIGDMLEYRQDVTAQHVTQAIAQSVSPNILPTNNVSMASTNVATAKPRNPAATPVQPKPKPAEPESVRVGTRVIKKIT